MRYALISTALWVIFIVVTYVLLTLLFVLCRTRDDIIVTRSHYRLLSEIIVTR